VAGAIYNYTNRLLVEQGQQQQEALKFLIHFVGDIHQPMHVSFRSDKGGNTEKGSFMKWHKKTLHSVWDTLLIDVRLRELGGQYWSQYAEDLSKNITDAQISQWSACDSSNNQALSNFSLLQTGNPICPDVWAQKSAQYACDYAYVQADGTRIKNHFNLGTDYYERCIPIVEEQLQKGGIRLANTLTYLLKEDLTNISEILVVKV